MLRWLLGLAAVLSFLASDLRPAAGDPPAPLRKLLSGPLPDGDLVIRWIDVEAQRDRLGSSYGEEHPRMRELARRAALLRAAAEIAPPDDPPQASVRAYLQRRLAQIQVEANELTVRGYGPRHPAAIAAERARAFHAELVATLASGPAPDLGSERARAFAERADARGRLVFLEGRFGEKHPRLLAARAEQARTQTVLANVTIDPSLCSVLPRAFHEVLLDRTTSRAASKDDSEQIELDAGLDALVIDRAALAAECQVKARAGKPAR